MEQETFGQRIRRKREECCLGLRKTSTVAGISATYLSQIERDETIPPSERVIRRLADLLFDDFDELMRMAGRIPEYIQHVILREPNMFEFLRMVADRWPPGDELAEMVKRCKERPTDYAAMRDLLNDLFRE